ncbi:uncharacterized protein TRIVIDRAFT_219054 [Trichoderma virens Gv29-8]|uniref:Uncharacterized protein n=1 Tax=Hypocrea virens (strain Gv29-8 / FGSC 10586) TaxID=413071 RepID=G9MIG1_HYPVG|nr:uncharacterized protein TRIVIDRAFT_219054 [Trichoderma virens Gv29-8]EHK25278.1 hypothetical protein TRIVIDRAFT_219054 [Trichoderma virens Gv29-8]
MVGAAQYLDEEIDWVLSAVVGKKKQSYIQTHFKDKFGRSLNHNQIRYIKNKYGKDPRFNSPLVNTRAPRIATSPKPSVSGEQEDEDGQRYEIDFGSLTEVGLQTKVEEPQSEQKDEAVTMARAKRKRGHGDSGEGRSRLIKKITGPQRPEFQRDRVSSKTVEYETPPQQWSTLDLQLPTSHIHSASTPTVSLADNYHGNLHVTAHDGSQHPKLSQFHNTSTSVGWAPSASLNTWATINSPISTSVGNSVNTSALIHPPTSMEQPYHHPVQQNHMLLQTPAITQYHLQLPQTRLAALSASPFSPLARSVAPSPYQNYREQQTIQLPPREQDTHTHIEAPETPAFPNLAISEVEGQPHLDTLSSVVFPLIPSFQEMPIEPASSHSIAELPTLATGDVHEHH